MEDSNKFDFETVIDTLKRVLTEPSAFYQSMPVSGGYANPAIFVLVMGLLAGLVYMVLGFLGMGPKAGAVVGAFAIIMMPIFAVIGSFIGALLLYVIWKLLGTTLGFEAAYRSLAFSLAIMPVIAVLNAIPYLGQIAQILWGFWLLVIASQHVHGIGKQKALLVFGIIGFIMLWMNLSAEYTARKFQHAMQDWGSKVESSGEQINDMSSEELGEVASDFIGGLAAGSGRALSDEEKEAIDNSTAALSEFGKAMQELADQQESGAQAPSAEQLGQIFGKLAQGMGATAKPGNRQQTQLEQVLQRVPALSDASVGQLQQLAVIDKSSDSQTLHLAVNDDGIFATPSSAIRVLQGDAYIRYLIPMRLSGVSELTGLVSRDQQSNSAVTAVNARASVSDAAAAQAGSMQAEGDNRYGLIDTEQQTTVRNASISVYESDGTGRGDECGDTALLQIPAYSKEMAEQDEVIISLVCLQAQRTPVRH